jgi:hypothetical protein
MLDIRPVILERVVSPDEPVAEVVNEAKALTWTHRAEHALLEVEGGEFLLVRGGADGIEFELEPNGGFVVVVVDGKRRRVTLLAWHTHPRPTGPSDHDRSFLKALSQQKSRIYEMFADRRGTVFYAEDREEKS